MKILLLVVAVLLIIVSLLQGGKSNGLSAFTGNSDLGLFQNLKDRGPEKVMNYITMALGIIFFVLIVLIKVFE
jgi:protein translocase, SecG subunit